MFKDVQILVFIYLCPAWQEHFNDIWISYGIEFFRNRRDGDKNNMLIS